MSILPKNITEFHDKEYWNNFFKEQNSKPFEWYAEWNSLDKYLQKNIKKGEKILIIGCGNSRLSNDMYYKIIMDIL